MHIRTASWLPSMLTYKAQHILSLVWSSSLAHESPSTVVANYRLDGTVMRRAGKIYWHAANTGLTFRSYTPHNAPLILRKSCGAAMVAFVGTFFGNRNLSVFLGRLFAAICSAFPNRCKVLVRFL
jgi:hypothetical protein